MGCELTRRGFLGAAGSMALGAGAMAQGTGGGPRRVEIRQVGAKEAGRGRGR